MHTWMAMSLDGTPVRDVDGYSIEDAIDVLQGDGYTVHAHLPATDTLVLY